LLKISFPKRAAKEKNSSFCRACEFFSGFAALLLRKPQTPLKITQSAACSRAFFSRGQN